MSQSTAPHRLDDTPSPLAWLVIVLMVVLIHAFAIIIALSATPKDPPKINVLQAQILSAADAKRLAQSQAAPMPQATLNDGKQRHFQPSKPKYQAPITQDVSDMGQMPSYDTPISTPVFEPSEVSTPSPSPNPNIDNAAPTDAPPQKTVPSANFKKAAQSATARVMAAWQNYDNIGGKKLTVTITLDAMGNVINVKAGKGDQELAQTAIAAVHDAAPFTEIAGMTDKLTIQFISTELPDEP